MRMGIRDIGGAEKMTVERRVPFSVTDVFRASGSSLYGAKDDNEFPGREAVIQMAKKIMTVDDSSSMRQMVGMTLKGAGYQVVEAEHGQDALDKLAKTPVDMLIIDLNMPVMDGITLIKNLRGMPQYKFTPLIMLTTESQASRKAEGKSAGATGWIVKPFKPPQLLGVIKKVLG